MKKLVLTALSAMLFISLAMGAVYTEGFDGMTPPALPTGWAVSNVNGDTYTWVTYSSYYNTSAPSLAIRWNSSMAMDDWAFSPGVTLTGGTAYSINFYYRVANSTWPEKLELKYGSSQTVAGMTIPIVDFGAFTNTTPLLSFTFFTPPTSGVYYFGWHGYSDADMFYLAIDDITIDLAPAVIAPSNLTTSEIGAFSAKLGWTENNSPAATAWDIVYGAPGFDPDLATPIAVSANPFELTGLTPETMYEWYVRANDGSKEISAWTGPAAFKTHPDIDFYWIEDVETSSIFDWSIITGSGDWAYSTDASAYGVGSQSFIAQFYNISGSDPFYLISPAFDLSGYTNTQLTFDYAYATYIDEADQLDVYYSVDGTNLILMQAMPGGLDGILNTAGSTYDPFVPTASQWETITLDLPSDAIMVFFGATSAYGNNLYIDNITITGDDGGTVPVELTSFAATLTVDNFVNLTWVTQTETDMAGFKVLRSETDVLANAAAICGLIDATNSSEQHVYTYSDTELVEDGTYHYWLEMSDLDGTTAYQGPVSVIYTAHPDDPETPVIPTVTKLIAAYPNPFVSSTAIRYSVKDQGPVKVEIYNLRGQLVRGFQVNHGQAGFYQVAWDGRDAGGNNSPSGIYLYRLTAGKYTETKRLVLTK